MRLSSALLTAMLTMTVVPAMAATPAGPSVVAAPARTVHEKASLRQLVGAVVTVDQTAKTLTVKTRAKQARELTFTVDDPAAAKLSQLHPGDRVRVRYARSQGKLDAVAISIMRGTKS